MRIPFGYEPQGAAAYLGLYVSMLVSAASGFALAAIRYDFGPLSAALFDDFSLHALYLLGHNISSYLIVAFVPAHIIGMMRLERRSGSPVAQAMVSGYKYEPSGERPSS
jgi:Ni,Fe-hydrogenase I cytochrome b subunit